jgi:hypothetical protein
MRRNTLGPAMDLVVINSLVFQAVTAWRSRRG